MRPDALLAQLKQYQEQASDQNIRDLVFETLTENRAEAVVVFGDLLGKMNGALRQKLLETLVEDGGEDLIPLFIETIRQEPNLIHAKSVLFLYGNFEHQSALDALLSLQEEIRPQLEPVWRKTSSILKSRFKEYYAIWLFKNGLKDPGRLDTAREQMTTQPHPSYQPFLTQIIAESRYLHRLRGVEILGIIGNRAAMASMFRLLPRVFDEIERCRAFYKFLTSPVNLGADSLTQYLEFLSKAAGWPEGEAEKLLPEIRQEKVWSTLVWAQEGFKVPDNEFWDEASQFLRGILLNKDRDERTRTRLDNALETFDQEQHTLAETLCVAMGKVGRREEVPNLLPRFVAQLPDDEALRDHLTVAFLTTYRGEEGRELLLELLNPKKPVPLLKKVLEVLKEYDFDEVPSQILDLILNPCDIEVRKTAQELLALCGGVEFVLPLLMTHKSNDIRADTVDMIASLHLEAGYKLLLDQLSYKISNNLLEKVVIALGTFERDRHAAPVMSFLSITHPYSLRRAAMNTLLLSTEKRRFAMIVASILQYQPRPRVEMLEMLMELLVRQETLPPDLSEPPSFWTEVLNAPQDTVRLGALDALERVPPQNFKSAEPWVKLLKLARGKHSDLRSDEERERIDKLREKIQATLETGKSEEEKVDKPKHKLGALLDKLEGNPDRGRAFRHFNLVFKPEMPEAEPDQAERLHSLVLEYVKANLDAPSQLSFLKQLLAKIGDISLIQKISKLMPEDRTVDLPKSNEKPKAKVIPEKPASGGVVANGSPPKAATPPSTPETPSKPTPSEAPVAAGPPESEERKELGRIRKILLVDDSQLFANAMQRVLEGAGFEVVCESAPARGLLALARRQFDLLILDYAMPGLNGIEFLAEARKRKRVPTRTMFITSSRDRKELNQMMQSGANALLLKPFPADELLNKISGLQPQTG
ncbi:MAG: response regulator [Acidobacteriota bacterium]|nr:response regulator [Acidobacteriota bacterium]